MKLRKPLPVQPIQELENGEKRNNMTTQVHRPLSIIECACNEL